MEHEKDILIRKKLKDIFKIENFNDGLFYDFKYAVRFELSIGKLDEPRLHMFLQAWNKFNKIFNFVFKDSKKIDVVLCIDDYMNIKKGYPKAFHMLRKCGFKPPKKIELYKTICVEDGDEANVTYRYLYYFTIKKESFNIKSIVWAILGRELGIKPTAGILAYFIDFDRKILVYPYDDRGCDVIGVKKEDILPIYVKFKDWLLDYDKKRMRDTFEKTD